MSEPKTRASRKPKTEGELMTLTEVSQRTGISMPTLQKYKKKYADRIPSKGKGRTQRYPAEALPVFEEIRKESSARRGRPPKAKGASAKPARTRATRPRKSTRRAGTAGRARGKSTAAQSSSPAARSKAARSSMAQGEGMLSLTEISKRTGISYPTLMRYVKVHLDSIPHQGEGRKRRFPPEAVESFQKLYAKPRGGGRPAAAKAKAGAGAGAKKKAKKAVKSVVATVAAKAKKAGRAAKSASKRTASVARRGTRRPATGSEVTRVLARLEGRLKALEKELKKPIKVEIRR